MIARTIAKQWQTIVFGLICFLTGVSLHVVVRNVSGKGQKHVVLDVPVFVQSTSEAHKDAGNRATPPSLVGTLERLREEKSLKSRTEKWSAAILEAKDPDTAFALFVKMPTANNLYTKELVLAQLFDRYGLEAFEAARRAGVGIELIFNGLRRSGVDRALPMIQALCEGLRGENRTPVPDDLTAIMRFLAEGRITDSGEAWSELANLLPAGNPDGDTVFALMQHGNPDLGKRVLNSFEEKWAVTRLRQSLLSAVARRRGHSPDEAARLSRELNLETGVSQAKRFSSSTAIHMALTGDEEGSLRWAGGLSDAAQRDAAIEGALSYLGSMSSLRALRLVVSDPELRGNAALLDAAVAAVGDSLGDRDSRDLEALRNLAATDPAVFEILEQKGLERVLQQASEK
jgi:hypothetical protein